MKITYLGTAAAEGLPAVWCNCDACKNARKKGGRDIRTRSQVLINDDALIDFPMDTYMHALTQKLDLSAVKSVFITHAHMDHCYPQEFLLHGEPFAHNMVSPVLTVYGNEKVLTTIREHNKAEQRENIAQSVKLKALKPYDEITDGNYRILALPAQHTKDEDCLIYILEQNGKRALMFNDSGILPNEVYDELAKRKIRLNLISFDCTYGYARHGVGRHMGLLDNLDELQKMRERGIADKDTVSVLTHFSHNGNLTYAELCEKASALGLTVAYDGLIIEV